MTFPSSDVFLRHVVTSEVDDVRRNGGTLGHARRNLRALFPHIDLLRQRAVRIGNQPTEVWFAFRDGRKAVPCHTDMWWTGPGTAKATLHASGRLTRATNAFRQIFGIPRPVPALVVAKDIVSNQLWPKLSLALLGLNRHGSLSTRLTVKGDSALPTELEFHIERDDIRPERFAISVRTLDERDAAHAARAIGASSLMALGQDKRRLLSAGAVQRPLAQGQRLSEALVGDPWAALVVCGIVRLYVATEGLEPTVQYAGGGSLVGTHLVPVGESMAIGLQAVTPALIIHVDPGEIERARRSDGSFARALATDSDVTLSTLLRTYAMRSSADLRKRLAREVLMISDLQDEASLVRVTEQQLADGLGSIRESVARELASFRSRKLVATTRYGLMPLDLDGLRALADGGV